ncbi:MAG: hypothetical protein ACRD3Q_04895, partial [Terriglobales bacterium]
MPPFVATILCIAFILWLFWLDKDKSVRPSMALWIPTAWFFFACSRSFGKWLSLAPTYAAGDAADVMGEGSPADKVVYAFLLVLALIVLLNRSERVKRFLRYSWPVVLCFGYAFLSIAWSSFPDIAFKRWTKGVGDLIMVLVVWTDPRPIDGFKRLIARLAFVLIPLSELLDKYYPKLGRIYDRGFGNTMYIGVTSDKNGLGAICLLLGLATFWRLLQAFEDRDDPRRKKRLIAHCLILVLTLWLLKQSNSMTATSCLLVAMSAMCAARWRLVIRSQWLIHCVVFWAILIPASVALLGASPELLKALGRNPTLTDRTFIWAEV